MRRTSLFLALLCSLLSPSIRSAAQFPEPNGGSVERGVLPDHWATGGPKCMEMPEWQVHEYNPNLYLLRQSGCTDYEKPFIFLIFGKDKALLLDTGSRKGNLVPTLQLTVHRWLQRNSRQSMPLDVVHTHEHGDHTAGDAAVQAMNDPAIPVTFVAATVEANKGFYRIQSWPAEIGSVDLGDRVIDAIPIPGHSDASIALYDRQTGILFSGDTVYPGRLYVRNFADYAASIARLVKFTEGKPIAHILGNHIEQTSTPFFDYPIGTMYQPKEHELQLSRGTLLELSEALASLHGEPKRLALRDVTIWPSGPPTGSAAEREAARKAMREYQEKQQKQMWDQP